MFINYFYNNEYYLARCEKIKVAIITAMYFNLLNNDGIDVIVFQKISIM